MWGTIGILVVAGSVFGVRQVVSEGTTSAEGPFAVESGAIDSPSTRVVAAATPMVASPAEPNIDTTVAGPAASIVSAIESMIGSGVVPDTTTTSPTTSTTAPTTTTTPPQRRPRPPPRRPPRRRRRSPPRPPRRSRPPPRSRRRSRPPPRSRRRSRPPPPPRSRSPLPRRRRRHCSLRGSTVRPKETPIRGTFSSASTWVPLSGEPGALRCMSPGAAIARGLRFSRPAGVERRAPMSDRSVAVRLCSRSRMSGAQGGCTCRNSTRPRPDRPSWPRGAEQLQSRFGLADMDMPTESFRRHCPSSSSGAIADRYSPEPSPSTNLLPSCRLASTK